MMTQREVKRLAPSKVVFTCNTAEQPSVRLKFPLHERIKFSTSGKVTIRGLFALKKGFFSSHSQSWSTVYSDGLLCKRHSTIRSD
jgi:hypothetical protein